MASIRTAVEDAEDPVQCWCCGGTDDPARLVRLGNHPEVALCVRCAHSVSKWAWEIEDRSKSGPLVSARDGLRGLRRAVIGRGWQHNRVLGGPFRWMGRRLP